MWFSILLRGENGNIKKEIPITWVHSLDIVQVFKRGISNTKNHLIYYSKNKNDDPNFKLPVRGTFDDTADFGCYHAKIREVAATEEQAQRFNANHRAVLPAIYNANLARYDWNAPTPTPVPSEQLAANVKLEKENVQLKETIVHLQNRIGAEDLTVDEMQDIQETLMDDDDGLEWLQNTLPMPIGRIKSEPVAADELEVSSMNTFVLAEDHGISPNSSQNFNDSSIAGSLDVQTNDDSPTEPIASTSSAVTCTSNVNTNTFADSFVNATTTHDVVCGSIEFVLDANLGRFFPCANVLLPAVSYGLLEYYNDVQTLRGIGEVYDLKYIHIMLKGFLGIEKMSQMVDIDYNDPIILLAKRLFEIRVDGDKNRMTFFENLVGKCIESVRDKVFYNQFKK